MKRDEQPSLFQVPHHVKEQSEYVNPMVRKAGFGPADKKCKDCSCLYYKETRSERRYYKCRHRKETSGPGSDIRLKWRACKLFSQREEGEEIKGYLHW